MITRDFIVSGIAADIFVFYLLEIVTSVYIFIICPSNSASNVSMSGQIARQIRRQIRQIAHLNSKGRVTARRYFS